MASLRSNSLVAPPRPAGTSTASFLFPAVKRAEGEPECEERPCPANLAPVCSTDGRTYDNECLMESCKGTKACDGPCPCGGDSAGELGNCCSPSGKGGV